jgi:hypothetical protein
MESTMTATASTLDDALIRWRTNLASLTPSRGELERDLEQNAGQLATHPFIRALAGEAPPKPGPLPEEEELDVLQDPAGIFLVLDADGSQRMCLEAAARGHSFVIQGAPRSGKKQTIVNLVAEALAKRKKVLIVSTNTAALNNIARRLRQVGLGDYCLEATGSRVDMASRLADLGSKGAIPSPAGGDFQKLKDCQTQLTAYIRALHAIRAPLERSAWSMLGELAKFADVPTLPLGLASSRKVSEGSETSEVLVTEVTASWLEEARQAVQRLQQLWHIRDEADFPWWGFKAERYTKQLRDDVIGLVERVRSRLERLLTVAAHFADQVGCEGPVAHLVKTGELLESAPASLSADWLQSPNLADLAKDLEHCAGEYERLGSARAPLTERYGPSIWQLPEGTSAGVDQAWHAAAPLLPVGDGRGGGLLSHQQQLRGWAADTQKRIPGWITEAHTLEKWLAIALPRGAGAEADPNKTDPGTLHLRQLQRLANLCMTDNPPERTWVHNPQALEEARALIAANKGAFASFHRRRRELLEVYKESFFELELGRMAAGFAGPYQSWLRIFNKQFRRDRRALRRRTKTEILRDSVAQEVQAGSEVQDEKTRLEAEQPKRLNVLGRYERGLETDLEAAEKGSRVAAEAVELVHKLGFTSLPPRFVDVLCGGAAPPEKIRAAAKRLHDSLGAWQHATQELKDILPLEQLPGIGAPLEESALSQLNRYCRDLQAALNHFAALTDQVLARARTRPPDAVTLVADLHQAEDVRVFEVSHEAEGLKWQKRLGKAFQGLATDWNALTKQLNWAKRAQGFFQGPPPERFVQLACTGPGKGPSFRELRAAADQYEQALHSLEIRFDSPGPVFQNKRLREHPPDVVKQRLAVLRDRAGDLADWIEARQLPVRFGHLGLRTFFDGLQKASFPAGQLVDVFMKSFLGKWLEAVFQQDPALTTFKREAQDQLQAEFRQGDQDWQHQNVGRIIQEIGKSSPGAAVCILANPQGVSGSLPEFLGFDLVLFAEASNILTEEALPAIYRGRQIIVSGDDRQPGPSETQGAVMPESLMDACTRAGLPRLTLRQTYGSRHESLMAFANAHLYGNHLGMFFSPFKSHAQLGVRFHHVPDGVLEDDQNIREIGVAADLVLAHLEAAPEKSLGVIAFDPTHAAAIAGEIERRSTVDLKKLGEDKAEPFYVKDARSVAGEDRDVIVISLSYAKDKTGALPAPLEPLDQEEGTRLLNAAITRARHKLIVVSSVRARDIDPAINTAEGVLLLRQFLEFAETGVVGSEERPTEPSPLERDIIREMKTRGFTVQTLASEGAKGPDLAVVDPADASRFVLGIVLDGPPAFAVSTARERDRLRHEEWQRLGWNLHTLWAPAWAFNRKEEIERLLQRIPSSASAS